MWKSKFKRKKMQITHLQVAWLKLKRTHQKEPQKWEPKEPNYSSLLLLFSVEQWNKMSQMRRCKLCILGTHLSRKDPTDCVLCQWQLFFYILISSAKGFWERKQVKETQLIMEGLDGSCVQSEESKGRIEWDWRVGGTVFKRESYSLVLS